MTKFWLDPAYTQYTKAPVPLRLETLYRESAHLYLITIIVAVILPFTFPTLIHFWSIYQSGKSAAIKTIGTIVRCYYVSMPGKLAPIDAIRFSIEYRRIDGTFGQGELSDVSGTHNCDEFPIGLQLTIGYYVGTEGDYLYNFDDRLGYAMSNLPLLFIVSSVVLWLFALFCIAGLRRYFLKKREAELLSKHGRLIDGVLVSCTGEIVQKIQFEITVVYKFQIPEGEEVTRKQKGRRDDLKDRLLPTEGTPITVLYVDQQIHCML